MSQSVSYSVSHLVGGLIQVFCIIISRLCQYSTQQFTFCKWGTLNEQGTKFLCFCTGQNTTLHEALNRAQFLVSNATNHSLRTDIVHFMMATCLNMVWKCFSLSKWQRIRHYKHRQCSVLLQYALLTSYIVIQRFALDLMVLEQNEAPHITKYYSAEQFQQITILSTIFRHTKWMTTPPTWHKYRGNEPVIVYYTFRRERHNDHTQI